MGSAKLPLPEVKPAPTPRAPGPLSVSSKKFTSILAAAICPNSAPVYPPAAPLLPPSAIFCCWVWLAPDAAAASIASDTC